MKIQHKTTILAQAISLSLTCAILCQPSFAMQALEDEHLENITGEGIAFVLNDFHLRFNGADTNNDGQGTYGTGYTHLIPVGPLSTTITDHNAATPNANGTQAQKSRALYDTQMGKGDVYLYGLSISGNDGNANTQFNTDENTNKVDIGSADNPWLIQVKTETVPNFAGVASDLAYLGIEAPLFQNLINEEGNLVADSNTYNLKLGTWADAFVRDPSKAENDNAQFWLNSIGSEGHRYINGVDATGGTTLRENRLRLQAIINGVSLNGTSLKIFQTLDGASTAAGLGADYSHYNNTLGLAATLRINSGDATSVRAPIYSETSTDVTTENSSYGTWSLLHGGWNSTLSASQSSGNCNNSSSVTVSTNSGAVGCQFMVQSRTRTDTKTRTVTKTGSWTAASGLNNHVIRLSTREKGTTQGLLDTPALSGSAMPEFAESEGIYLYNPNINLVLGSQWQPLVLGVAEDGKNLVLELTRIPNVEAVYKEIYTDYTGADASYKGGTCSIYWCGGDGNGISKNATHSSITLGTTQAYGATGQGRLSAYTGIDAVGVSFGDLNAVQGQTQSNTGSTTTTVTVEQAQWIQRTNDSSVTWTYSQRCASSFLACLSTGSSTGTIQQWKYGNTLISGISSVSNAERNGTSSTWYFRYPQQSGTGYTVSSNTTTAGLCTGGTACTYYGTTANRNWTIDNYNSTYGLSFSTAVNNDLNTWLATQSTAARTYSNTNQAATPTLPNVAQPSFGGISPVNLGSAVIDGLLIQHLKITTKGL